MDLATISMDKEKARVAFSEYRRAVKDRHNAEDQAIMRGYRAMAQGQQLVNLRDAISAGGVDERGYPRLAVTKADERYAWLCSSEQGEVSFSPDRYPTSTRGRASGVYRFPAGTLTGSRWTWWDLRAMVPIVPPALRPAHSLSGYAVLWEVERWERVPKPPRDPALLKCITGDLYAVLAIWDLTDLERAVLGARSLDI